MGLSKYNGLSSRFMFVDTFIGVLVFTFKIENKNEELDKYILFLK